jgi:hypothetical protein
VTDPHTLAALLPGYEIGTELGRGGFGVVLAGRHKQLGRAVAIKELPPGLAGDPAVRQRFLAEARVLASLDHPHIVPIYDFVESGGVCLLVMEALPGGTVWSAFSEKGYPPAAACAVVMVACAGLHHAHQKGVLHRDVKPENLLLTMNGQVKVADFGIAKVLGDNDALATNAGEILGTPAYIAPEQAQGGLLGPQADVYAAGVMLYELLSGKLPFPEDGGGLAIVYRHVYEQPTPLLQVAPAIPPGLAEVVMRALARQPADRYASAEDFAVAIGTAATAAYGAGWFAGTGVPVLAGGPILASTQQLTATAPLAPPTAVIRPVTVAHVRGAAIDATPEALVPVRQVLANPPRPWAWAGLTAVGLVALAVLAMSPATTTLPLRGQLLVNGQDASLAPVVDLASPFTVSAPGVRPDTVTLDLGVAGIALVATSPGKPDAAGTVAVKAQGSRYLVAGAAEARVHFLRGGRELRTVAFPLRSKGNAFLTAPGIAAVLGALFFLAYAESQLAPLRRRGRRRLASLVGLAVTGAGLGALSTVFAWLLGSELLQASAIGNCAAVGAVTGVLLGVTTYKAGRRARLRRIARLQSITH